MANFLKGKAALILLSAALLLSACSSDNKENDNGTTEDSINAGTETTPVAESGESDGTETETAELPSDTSEVIYQDEVEENMNIYRIKTFDSIDAVDWNSVTAASVNNYKWVECDTFETYAKLVYVKDWGFLCQMTCIEDKPAATFTEFCDTVCLDSCMEFFAIWDNDVNYLNIESNSLGTLCVQYGMNRESRRTGLRFLKADEMFKMNPVVEDGRWTLTMEIPLEKLQKFYGDDLTADTFVSGYSFRGNFYKTGSADITGNEHYAMWNDVGTENPDFHRPEYFGKFIIE